jgi:hypothetical protein
MRTYQLYLSTLITTPASNNIVPINVTNKANVTWQVDFKSLFGNDYGLYSRCSVRCHLVSTPWVSTATDSQSNDGYISLNLPSTFCASTSKGTPIALLYSSIATNITPGSPPTIFPGLYSYYNVNTLGNNQGTDINIPSQNQLLNIQLLGNDSFAAVSSYDYSILLQFELSEPI